MKRLILVLRLILAMSYRRISRSTVSKARDRSTATMMVRLTGFSRFSPALMWETMSCRAVVVLRPFLKLCWCSARLVDSCRGARIRPSRSLAGRAGRLAGNSVLRLEVSQVWGVEWSLMSSTWEGWWTCWCSSWEGWSGIWCHVSQDVSALWARCCQAHGFGWFAFFDCLPDLDLCDNYFRLVWFLTKATSDVSGIFGW